MNADAPNPYQPPKPQDPPLPSADAVDVNPDTTVTCTFTIEPSDLAAGIDMAAPGIWVLPVAFGLIGFATALSAGTTVRLATAVVAAGLGWLVRWNRLRLHAGRALANRTEAERAVCWRFGPEGVEMSSPGHFARMQWLSFHRFMEGRRSFVLYPNEAMVHVIPKRALSAEQMLQLRAMLKARITPRKQPTHLARFIILWMVLVLVFLAVWQFLQPDGYR